MAVHLQFVWISGFSLFTLILTIFIIAKCCGCCSKNFICTPFVMITILFIIFLFSTIAVVKDADSLAETPHEDALKEGENLMRPINNVIDPVRKFFGKPDDTNSLK